MALLVKSDGTEQVVLPKNGKDFSLEELQSFVGGYIQMCPCMRAYKGYAAFVCNEEGKLDGLPTNEIATKHYNPDYGVIDVVVGDVLFYNSWEVL